MAADSANLTKGHYHYKQPQFWIRIGRICILIGIIGIGMTACGMIATFNRVAAMGHNANPATLADGISESLTWTILGMLFFWPGVVFIGYWFVEKVRQAL